MFCTKCGKELHKDDRFCAYCGTEVRTPERFKEKTKYEDVVFNPPFKLEAEKTTQEILKTTENRKPEKENSESVSFDWNLEGFPSTQPRKTEAVDFNWDSVVERRNRVRETQQIPIEEIRRAEESARQASASETAKQTEIRKKDEVQRPSLIMERNLETENAEAGEDSYSIEELEKEIFGEYEKEKELQRTREVEPVRGQQSSEASYPSADIAGRADTGTDRSRDTRVFAERTEHAEQKDPRHDDGKRPTLIMDMLKDKTDVNTAADPAIVEGRADSNISQQAEQDETEAAAVIEKPLETKFEAATPETEINPQHQPQKLEERFYTFHQKNEEFQKLLDKERARIEAIGMECGISQKDKAGKDSNGSKVITITQPMSPVSIELDIESDVSITPAGGAGGKIGGKAETADAAGKGNGGNTAGAGTADQNEGTPSTEEKLKLRYSDVFPRIPDDGNGGSNRSGIDSDQFKKQYDEIFSEEEKPKKHILLKIVITILVILILLEGTILAAKFIAPESTFSQKANDIVFKIADMFSGGSSGDSVA